MDVDSRPALGRYSFGVGDRFAQQAAPQLRAFRRAAEDGVEVTPVWNKSNREHLVVGSEPASARMAADAAARELGWDGPYFVDADHVTLETVDRFVATSDFFTLDVAGVIGRAADEDDVERFVRRHGDLLGGLELPGLERPLELAREDLRRAARHYLVAAHEAGRIYRRVRDARGDAPFATEVSMDETGSAQSAAELLVILAALVDEGIPVDTVAPKFSGRFNKGVDYVGDLAGFAREFAEDVAVVGYAAAAFGLPSGLKLSVHSGSDKFSLFPVIHDVLCRTHAGVHVKTSGTTWLEELIGLAEAGDEGLALAKEVYAAAYARREALCAPYAAVIDIDAARLPSPQTVERWSGEELAAAVRHDPTDPRFDANVRQLVHVGYGIAAAMGARYTRLLAECRETVAGNVEHNIYERHLRPLFVGP
jgi:hypothetical protein